MTLTKIKCIPIVIQWSIVPRPGYITARDQIVVESGVKNGGKNIASFHFREWTQQHKHKA